MAIDRDDNLELRHALQAAKGGDEQAIHGLWEACLDQDFHRRALAKFKRRYPQFGRLVPDLYGEAVMLLHTAICRFDEARAKEVSWAVLAGFYYRIANRDLLRFAAQHGGDGGAVDVPRRETERRRSAEYATTYVDGLPLSSEEEGLDPWDWAELQPDTDQEATMAALLDVAREET